MRVARGIYQDVAEDAIDQPGWRLPSRHDLVERDLQLVQRIVARLVDAWMLAGRADEQAGEKVRERWVVVPIA